jgi:glycogen debranching enzyme
MLSPRWKHVLLCLLWGAPVFAQQLHPLADLPLRQSGPVLHQPVQTGEPFTVAGERGVIVGQQQGECEAWVLPVKLLSHLSIEANVAGYPVPLELNTMAREIEVRPDRTTITYSHIAVTVRQIMFAPDEAPDGTGAVVLFAIDSVRPVDLVIRFTPELRKMWPALSSSPPSSEWVRQGASGWYMLHSDFDDLAGAIALPGAVAGVMAPYQERPQVHPLEFHLHFDPAKDHGRLYPLLMAVGETRTTASQQALAADLQRLNDTLPMLYAEQVQHYTAIESTATQLETPDTALNNAMLWAAISIEQLRARARDGEVGLVAGYYASGDSARPGFGWFFGRDALYTLFAVHSFGDFSLSRTELEFLLKRQRADGKIMHEYSQTADQVDWAALPYEYAAADATPLFLLAMEDYVRSSGDVVFLQEHREAVLRAWQFETTHDSDGDGIYDNAQGTGWVESWPPGMPKQEIYLASLDEQASRAMHSLAHLLQEDAAGETAAVRADRIHAVIEREYYEPSQQRYGFSWNHGSLDTTNTIYPAIAWWSDAHGLAHPQASLAEWSSHQFATDWGARDIADDDPLYDGISYHQGSVWPLFTGWSAMAQYRSGNALAGYQAAMQNVDLTTPQDIGAVTELLSGDFFEPFGRSTSHQLWSSAMVITPVMRGMFGVQIDALTHTISVAPHLPAQWQHATIRHLHVGEATVDLQFERTPTAWVVTVQGAGAHLANIADGVFRVPLPVVEVGVTHELPLRGARTTQMKVLAEKQQEHSLTLTLEALAGSTSPLYLRLNRAVPNLKIEGAERSGDTLLVHFDAGTGYVQQTVTLHW